VALLAVGVVGVWMLYMSRHLDPYLKQQAIIALHDEFHADVDLANLQITAFPRIHAHGTNLVLRQTGKEGVPPLLEIREFDANVRWKDLFAPHWTVNQVRLSGLRIHIPPKGERPHFQPLGKKQLPMIIRELTADDSQLEIIPAKPAALPHVFEIHHLFMRDVRSDKAAEYMVELTNAIPPGEIQAKGTFGPWMADEPGDTPLTGKYDFANANLGVFKGITGTLSSQGEFQGTLDDISVQGKTDIPNFALRTSGKPVALHTEFEATVDGTNGNTILNSVQANWLHTTVLAKGDIAKRSAEPVRTISLSAIVNRGKIEDMMFLAVKAQKPLMTGDVSLRAQIDLPPIHEDMIDRLVLNGQFAVSGAEFTNAKVSEKVETLSRKGLGKPNDEDAGSAVSDLKGKFSMNGAVLEFHQLSFEVPGASVHLQGTYGLDDEQLDFHGNLRLRAKLSQTMTGAKSFLLKPFDPFFRKGNATELPIKVTGTKDKPEFALELHRPKPDEGTKAAKGE